MTLIIFSRYEDGFIIISDRQGSFSSGDTRSDRKIYFPENREYYLALAGDATRILQVYSMLNYLRISKNDLRTKLKSLIDETYFKQSQDVEGLLLIKNKVNFDAFRVTGNYDNSTIFPLDSPFECYGISGAKSVANFLANFDEIENLDLEKAIDYLVAIMNSVSQKFDGISTIEVGFDVIVFSDDGDIYECFRFNKKRTGRLNFSFRSSKIDILSEFSRISPVRKRTKVKKKARRKKLERKRQKFLEKFQRLLNFNRLFH